MISQLNVEFNSNAVKMINQICKCDPIEGVSVMGEEIGEDKSNKYSGMASTALGN